MYVSHVFYLHYIVILFLSYPSYKLKTVSGQCGSWIYEFLRWQGVKKSCQLAIDIAVLLLCCTLTLRGPDRIDSEVIE